MLGLAPGIILPSIRNLAFPAKSCISGGWADTEYLGSHLWSSSQGEPSVSFPSPEKARSLYLASDMRARRPLMSGFNDRASLTQRLLRTTT